MGFAQRIVELVVQRLGGAEAASPRLGVPASLLREYIAGAAHLPEAAVERIVEAACTGAACAPLNQEQEDFAVRLASIENEANLIAQDLPPGVTRNRALHIATTARLLRARFDVASTVIAPPKPSSNR